MAFKRALLLLAATLTVSRAFDGSQQHDISAPVSDTFQLGPERLTCPKCDGIKYTANNGIVFAISCSKPYQSKPDGSQYPKPTHVDNFEQCIYQCSLSTECSAVAYTPGYSSGGVCYLAKPGQSPNGGKNPWYATKINNYPTSQPPYATATDGSGSTSTNGGESTTTNGGETTSTDSSNSTPTGSASTSSSGPNTSPTGSSASPTGSSSSPTGSSANPTGSSSSPTGSSSSPTGSSSSPTGSSSSPTGSSSSPTNSASNTPSPTSTPGVTGTSSSPLSLPTIDPICLLTTGPLPATCINTCQAFINLRNVPIPAFCLTIPGFSSLIGNFPTVSPSVPSISVPGSIPSGLPAVDPACLVPGTIPQSCQQTCEQFLEIPGAPIPAFCFSIPALSSILTASPTAGPIITPPANAPTLPEVDPRCLVNFSVLSTVGQLCRDICLSFLRIPGAQVPGFCSVFNGLSTMVTLPSPTGGLPTSPELPSLTNSGSLPTPSVDPACLIADGPRPSNCESTCLAFLEADLPLPAFCLSISGFTTLIPSVTIPSVPQIPAGQTPSTTPTGPVAAPSIDSRCLLPIMPLPPVCKETCLEFLEQPSLPLPLFCFDIPGFTTNIPTPSPTPLPQNPVPEVPIPNVPVPTPDVDIHPTCFSKIRPLPAHCLESCNSCLRQRIRMPFFCREFRELPHTLPDGQRPPPVVPAPVVDASCLLPVRPLPRQCRATCKTFWEKTTLPLPLFCLDIPGLPQTQFGPNAED